MACASPRASDQATIVHRTQGVCSLVHESPFYGARRPADQKGSKLQRVSDLMALGWVRGRETWATYE